MKVIMLIVLVCCVLAAFFLGYESKPAVIFRGGAASSQTFATAYEQSVTLKLAAVDLEGRGALADLNVALAQGRGEVYLSINGANPIVNPDTQASMRTAVDVARQLSGKNSDNANVYLSINTPSQVVGGGSAGAAITVATIALLRGERLRGDTLITGTVNADGTIDVVGKVLEKARAVKAAGYNTFLVPRGESVQRVPREECRERLVEGGVIRECQTFFDTVKISDAVGINVVEVQNVKQAYDLMVDQGA